jgi:hypothetical protein
MSKEVVRRQWADDDDEDNEVRLVNRFALALYIIKLKFCRKSVIANRIIISYFTFISTLSLREALKVSLGKELPFL